MNIRFLFDRLPLRMPDDGAAGGGAAAAGAQAGGGDGGQGTGGAGGTGAADAGGQGNGGGAGAAADAAPAGGANAGGANSGGTWLDSLSPDERAWATAKGYKQPADALRGAHAAERLIGYDKVVLPKDDSPQEVKDAFFKAIGRPDDPKGYEFKAPENVKDYDAHVSDWFAQTAHKLGMPKAMAAGLHDEFMKLVAVSQGRAGAASDDQRAANEAKLRENWGVAFDAKLERSNRAIRHFGGDAAIARFKELGLNHDPELNEMFAKIGESLKGDSLAGAGAGGGSMAMTPAEAQAEIAKVNSDKAHAYHVKGHPDHKAAVDRMAGLYAMAYPENPAR